MKVDITIEEARKNVGEVVRRLREKKKLSQSELAKLAGIDDSTLSRVERGKGNRKFDVYYKIARALKVQLNVLFKAPKTIITQENNVKTEF